ncbi:chain length determinant protein [Streptomyces sp. NPDC090025]|uniref:chain length determinant protein n=1 Tax=Streptomyces sp. NPDC090025 TaxID=3365922 RepID=UPI003833BB9A
MDLAEIFRVMCRRWYVLLPGLLLTAGLVVGAWLLVPVSYESQSTVAMLNSRKGAAADGNPFLSMEPSLTGMADSLARNINSDAAKAELKTRGLDETYEAKIADNAQGPLLWLTVKGEDSAEVLKGNKTLMAFTAERLKDLQADQSVAPEAMIRITTIVPPQDPQAQLKSKIQYLVMAAGLGLVLSLVATFFAEARRRAADRAGAAAEAARTAVTEPETGPGPGAETGPGPGAVRAGGRHRQDRDGAGSDRAGQEPAADDEAARPQPEHADHAVPGQPVDQPTVQLPVLPVAERRPSKRPPSWAK